MKAREGVQWEDVIKECQMELCDISIWITKMWAGDLGSPIGPIAMMNLTSPDGQL